MSKPSGISIIVCNYNADLDKILLTLSSCIKQKDCAFEVVYCDDGSKNNFEKEIISYFKSHNFSNYKMVCQKENQGTLKNLLAGIKVSTYEYCKTIGCGDLFYDELSLKRVEDYFKTTNSDIIFTKCCYFFDDGEIKTFNVSNPKDLKPYTQKSYNQKVIQKRLIMNQDMILGAGVYAKTDYLDKLYSYFVGKIKYTEDALIIYAAAFDAKIMYLNEYCVHYEYGTGISTSTNSEFQRIIQNESDSIFTYIDEDTKDKRIKKYVKIRNKIRYSKNSMSQNLRKMFLTPSQFKIKFKDKTCKKEKPSFDFYKSCKEDANRGI